MTTTEHRWNFLEGEHDSCTCGVRGGMGYLVEHWLHVGREAAKGELVTLDDPRLKPGARARLEWLDKDSDWCEAVEGLVERLSVMLRYPHTASRIYLLAEAPDPDREIREALQAALEDYTLPRVTRWPADELGELVALLRSRGFDIVRKGGPA